MDIVSRGCLRKIFLACVSLLMVSCGKHSIFSNGEPVTIDTLITAPFCMVELLDNVDVKLRHAQDTIPGGTVYIKAGENLIDNILVEYTADEHNRLLNKITVRNKNKANWLKPYENNTISATIYYDSIYQIIFNSNGNLYSDVLTGVNVMSDSDSTIIDTTHLGNDTVISHHDTIIQKKKKTIWLTILGGAGDIDLKANTECFFINYIEGTAAVKVSGFAGIAQTSTNTGCHGPIDADQLDTKFHFIRSYGTHRIKTKAFNMVKANNYNNGTIHFVEYNTTEVIYVNDSVHTYAVPQVVNVVCPKNGVLYNDELYRTQEYQNGMNPGLVKDTLP